MISAAPAWTTAAARAAAIDLLPDPDAAALLGREGRAEGLSPLSLVSFPALLPDEVAKGLIRQRDLSQTTQVFGRLAIGAVESRATDHLTDPLRAGPAPSPPGIQGAQQPYWLAR